MVDALDAYRNWLRELDKFESPTAQLLDFNYWWNSATDEYIANNYATFDVNQKTLDDISEILVLDEELTFVTNEVDLPEKYRHILGLETELKFLEALDGNAVDSTVIVNPKRLKTNQKGFRINNAYQQPSYKESYFQIAKGKLKILCGSKNEATTGKIDYLEIPETVYLNPDKSVDFNDPLNNTLLQFPSHVNFEIVKHCRKIFLENIESPRYQTSLQEQALRRE